MQAKSMDKKTVKKDFTRTETPHVSPADKKEADEVIRCNVNAKLRPFVLACVSKLRDTDKKAWHVSQIRSVERGNWDSQGEFLKISLYCCVGTQCVEKKFVVRKTELDGGPGDVTVE